jgi:hypothetical protein
MTRYRPMLLLIAALALPRPALAQQRALVVPADATVAIPARGEVPVSTAPPPRRARRVLEDRQPFVPATPAVSPLMVVLPLAAAAVLAATLAGGGGGGSGLSAPTRTR